MADDGLGTSGTHLSTLARGSALALAGMVANGLLGFTLVILLTRGLGTRGAGVLFLAVALFTILSHAAEIGADTGLVRLVARARTLRAIGEIRPMLGVAILPGFAVSTVMAIGVLVFAPFLATTFADGGQRHDAVIYLRVTAAFLPFATVMTVALAGTRGLGSVLPFVAIQNILVAISRPALVAIVLGLGLGSLALAVAWGVPFALGCTAALVVLSTRLRRLEREEPAAGDARNVRDIASEFWRFSAPRGVAGVFHVAILWIDVLILGVLQPDAQVGVYAAVSRTVAAGTFALQAVRLAVAPQISSLLATNERGGAQEVFRAGTAWSMAVSWPLYIVLAVFAPVVLHAFGAGFVQGEHALQILALAMLVDMGTGNVSTVLLMGGKSSWNLLNTGLAVVINVVLNLILIPHLGIVGAAYAWAASIMLENAAALIEVDVLLDLRPFGSGYYIAAAAAAVCFGGGGIAARSLLGPTTVALIATMAIGGAMYVLIIWRHRAPLRLSAFANVLRATRPLGP